MKIIGKLLKWDIFFASLVILISFMLKLKTISILPFREQ